MKKYDHKKMLKELAKQGFKIINGSAYDRCFECGKDIEIEMNDWDDPDGDSFAFCDCGFHIDYHAKDPWYFKKYYGEIK